MLQSNWRLAFLSFVSICFLVDSVAAFAPSAKQQRAVVYRQESSPLVAAMTNTNNDVNPRFVGLALLLDDGTRKSHSIAQNSAFVSGFFRGLSTREAYRALLTSLYFVYQTMEDAFDQTHEGRVQVLDNAELRRMDALERDMDYFYGPDWRSLISPSPATRVYVERVQKVADKYPYLLVAHQYTRYLGDLFGGQMMSGMATRSLDLKDNKGVDFYKFEEIASVKDFITSWYQKLNALDLTLEEQEKIVDEANLVFDLNIAILEELEGSPFRAMWTLAINTMKVKFGISK
jgi:heme oxygenase (biliverdin-producing, ferredoxin)